MKFLIFIITFLIYFNLNSAFPHQLNKRQINKLDKLSYVLTDSIFESDNKNESLNDLSIETDDNEQLNNKIHKENTKTESTNRYSNLVTRIIKQILSKRTSLNNESYRRRKNVEQIEKNDLIKSSIIDKKFKYLSELTLKKLKPAFELQLPDMTPEEHDELVNDINKFINEDGKKR